MPTSASAAAAADPERRQWLARGAAGLGVLALSGCSLAPDFDHDGSDAPAASPLPVAPRVAWVLSSGGPRGFVHVGVIKALDELGLAPDLIVGASAGAFVGVMRASGFKGAELEALALDLEPLTLARLALGSSERLSGDGVAAFVRERIGERRLEQLPVPAVCVAHRLPHGPAVGFSRGDAGVAVQASAAIEGRFAPVRIRGERYLDADVSMPLPVRLARSLGAQRVLAVDASAHEDRAPAEAQRYREGDLRKRALTRPDAESADLLLHPDFGYWVNLSKDFRKRAINAGYRAAMDAAGSLRALHVA